MNVKAYWKATLQQDEESMRTFFHQKAYINWHNTNEHFTVEEFIRANCEYPGQWNGDIEREERMRDGVITVTHVYTCDRKHSFHVTSFIRIQDNKIIAIDEYWGDDGEVPQWRLEKHIGRNIQ